MEVMVLDPEDRCEMPSKDWLLLTLSCRPCLIAVFVNSKENLQSLFPRADPANTVPSPVLCSSSQLVSQWRRVEQLISPNISLSLAFLTWISMLPETPKAAQRCSLSAHKDTKSFPYAFFTGSGLTSLAILFHPLAHLWGTSGWLSPLEDSILKS